LSSHAGATARRSTDPKTSSRRTRALSYAASILLECPELGATVALNRLPGCHLGGDFVLVAHLVPSLPFLHPFAHPASRSTTQLRSASLSVAAAVASAVAGIAAATAAAIAARQQRRWGATDAFLRIADQFERDAYRSYRSIVYAINRDAFRDWTDEQTKAVDAWCAHLDLVAVLVQSNQINETIFLNLYGDVMLRTIYQIAPYCNYQITIRGKQFLLPLRLLAVDMVKIWRKRAAKRRYPLTIGFPAQPHLRVNPDLFDSDEAVVAFCVNKTLT
jgi:hypothetical protein